MKETDKNKAAYPAPRYAWSMVGLLTLAYIFSMLDRYILGYLIGPIKADLGFNDFEVGLLTGPAFTILYATTAIPIGLLVDRKRRTWIVATGIAIWSAFTVMTGFARTFVMMFISRMMVGVGEAVLSPSAFSIIGDSFPPERRAKPIAFYSSALVVASGLTGLIIAVLLGWAEKMGEINLPLVGVIEPWQLIFLSVGAPGLVVAVIFLLVKEPPRTESPQKTDIKLDAAFVFVGSKLATFLCFVSLFVTMVSIAYAHFNWLPEMFERSFGTENWSRRHYAARNGTATMIIGLSTYLISGWLSDHWSARGQKDAPFLLSIIGFLIMVPSTIMAPLMPTGWSAFALLCVSTVGIGMVSCTGVTALLQIVPGHVRGTVVALYYMTISFVGGFISPPLVGWLSAHVFGEANLNLAMAVQPAIFGIPTLLLLPLTLKLYRQELATAEKDHV